MDTKTENALLIALACAKVQPPVDVRVDGAGPARPEPGTYARGDVRLLLSYDLRVGPPTRRRVSAAIPWQRLALLALGRLNGATAEALVREAMDDAATIIESMATRVVGVEMAAKVLR